MQFLQDEKILWEGKKKQLVITSHRIRQFSKSVFGSKIKSIMLENVDSCELVARRNFIYLRRAIVYFLSLNLSVFILNKYLFKSELVLFFFDEPHIDSTTAAWVFYISCIIAVLYIVAFFRSMTDVFIFYSGNMEIEYESRLLDFEERESFLSKVEKAIDQRSRSLSILGDNHSSMKP